MTKALLMNSVAEIPAPTFDFIFDFTFAFFFDFIFDESDGTPYILWRSKMELGVHLGRLIGAARQERAVLMALGTSESDARCVDVHEQQ